MTRPKVYCYDCQQKTMSVDCAPCGISLCGLCATVVWVTRDGQDWSYLMCRECSDEF